MCSCHSALPRSELSPCTRISVLLFAEQGQYVVLPLHHVGESEQLGKLAPM